MVDRDLKRKVAGCLIIPALIGLATVLFITGMPDRAEQARAYPAPPFSWPRGCQPLRYEQGDPIAKACADPSQLISGPEKIGLSPNETTKHKVWYRVDNSAIKIRCGYLDRSDCSVLVNQKFKFYTPKN